MYLHPGRGYVQVHLQILAWYHIQQQVVGALEMLRLQEAVAEVEGELMPTDGFPVSMPDCVP